LDALILVNALNLQAAWGLPSKVPPGGAQPPYLDSTGDGHLTPADVLQVINYLNSAETSLAGEGEPWGNHAADGPRAALSVLLDAPWSREAPDPGLLPGQPQAGLQRTLAAPDRIVPPDAERSEEARRRWLGEPAPRGSGGRHAMAWDDELDFASLALEEVVSDIASAVATGWKA
jgi:hypothetical protein